MNRFALYTAAELAVLNDHLKYEGAMCCPDCRNVWLLEWGQCPSCAEEANRVKAALARVERDAQHRVNKKREAFADRLPESVSRRRHAPTGVAQTQAAPGGLSIRRSPLWDARKDGR